MHLDQVRVALLIEVVYNFAGGLIGIALPLLMLKRNISIVAIGLVFASMPIIFQVTRMLFATISEFWGRKLFYVLSGIFGTISTAIYYLARTVLEYLFGKVMDGTTSGSILAVDRAFLLEKSEKKWSTLISLQSVINASSAVGTLLAGFFIVWLSYEGTLMLALLIGAFVIPLSFLLVGEARKKFSVAKAVQLVDFRKKRKDFKIFLILFFVIGLSLGFRSGYIFPLFLSQKGFNVETIGILSGFGTLLSASFSYFVARRFEINKLILLSGVLCTVILVFLGFSSSFSAAILVLVYGAAMGLFNMGEEGIFATITSKESYGVDIGLLWMGHYIAQTISMAMSGFLISMWSFAAPFWISAAILPLYYVTAYFIMKK